MRLMIWLTIAASPLLLILPGCSAGDADEALSTASSPTPLEVRVAAVSRGDLAATVELVGNLLPSNRTIIVSEVDGVIAEIPPTAHNPVVVEFENFRETLPLGIGAIVKKDDLLVRINSSDYDRALRVVEAQCEKTRRDLEKLIAWDRPEEVACLRALRDEAEANQRRAEAEYERAKTLRLKQAISQSEFDEKEAQHLKARAMLAHAEASLSIAEAGPTPEERAVAEAELAAAEAEVELRRLRVEKCSIRAPYDGVITDRFVDVGDRVTALPRVEIMEIAAVRYLVAQVGVPERYCGQLKVLDPAQLQVQGEDEVVPALIVRVNDKIDPTSRTFRIRVAIDNSAGQLRPGQFVRVLLQVATSPNALAVPRQAITYAGGQPQVFVFVDGRVNLRPVQLGIHAEDRMEIISGLEEGEQVVVDDPAVLTDGMSVEALGSDSLTQVARRQR